MPRQASSYRVARTVTARGSGKATSAGSVRIRSCRGIIRTHGRNGHARPPPLLEYPSFRASPSPILHGTDDRLLGARELVGGGWSDGAGLSADAPDVGFVVGVDGALGPALIERAQGPAPVKFDVEPDDGLPAAPGVAHRVQPNGARPWVFRHRRECKPHRVTLRKPGAVKAESAPPAALPSSPVRWAAATPFASCFRPNAHGVRCRAYGKALAPMEGVYQSGSSPQLPRERHSARPRPSWHRLVCPCRCCAHLPRKRTLNAGRREPLSWRYEVPASTVSLSIDRI